VPRIVNPKLAAMTAKRSRQIDRMGRGTKGAKVWYDEYEMQAKPETIAQE
jgi:hypothetical protein